MQRLVLGLFDSLAAANEVAKELFSKGFPQESVHLTSAAHAPAPEPEAQEEGEGTFRRLLIRLGVLKPNAHPHTLFPESERRIFSEGLRRGGVVVAVNVNDDARLDQTEDTFERFGAVDIDERADEWRATGWTAPQTPREGEAVSAEVKQQSANTGALPETPPRRCARVFTPPEQPGQSGAGRANESNAKPPAAPSTPSPPAPPAQSAPPSEPGGMDADFRMHFGRVYGSSGHEYSYYLPAYQFGAELARRIVSDWETVEPGAREDWLMLRPHVPWANICDAVHYGFERVRTGKAIVLQPSEPPNSLPEESDAGRHEQEPTTGNLPKM